MAALIEVSFKGNRREFFLWESDPVPPLRAAVIVEADRGEDLGRVHATGDVALNLDAKVVVHHRGLPDVALVYTRRPEWRKATPAGYIELL